MDHAALVEELDNEFSDSFMKPEIWVGAWAYGEDEHGETRTVPYDYASILVDEGYKYDTQNGIGWLCRLSAPGYLDSTECAVFETEEACMEYLLEMYSTV
jgi:hypothetical protein